MLLLLNVALVLCLGVAEPAAAASAVPAMDTAAGQAPIAVSGTVTAASGRSARVSVALIAAADLYESGELLLNGLAYAGPEELAQAAPDGRFRLLAPGPGMWQVLASAEGHVPVVAPLHPLLEEADLLPVELPRDAGLRIRVVGPDGTAIPSARIAAAPVRPWRSEELFRPASWRPADRAGVTAQDGTVRLPRAAGETLSLEVTAPGFRAGRAEVARGEVTLTLDRGEEHRVQVLDPWGQPVAGAHLREAGFRLPSARTEELGRASVVPAVGPGGELAVLARSGEGVRARTRRPAHEESQGPWRLVLEPPARVEGRVLSLPEREPLAGALVWSAQDPGAFVRTDGRGSYALALTEPAEIRLAAAAPRHFSQEVSDPPVSGPAGVAYTFALEPRSALAGTVRADDGRRLAGVEVRAWFDPTVERLPTPRHRTSGGYTRSREEGRFRLGNLLPGTAYELHFQVDGWAARTVKAVAPIPGEAPEDLEVVLSRGLNATGTILDLAAEPVAGAWVELRPAELAQAVRRLAVAQRPERPRLSTAAADAEGRFLLEGVSPGRFDLLVSAEGYARARIPGVELPAAEGGDGSDLGTVFLPPEAAIEGFVLDSGGLPLGGAVVRAIPEDPLEAYVAELVDRNRGVAEWIAAGDGHFRAGGFGEGDPVELEITHAGYATARVSVRAPSVEPLEITLRALSRVSGRVVEAGGGGVPAARVAGLRPVQQVFGGMAATAYSPGSRRTRADEHGYFELADLEPGRVEIVASAPGLLERRLSLTIPAGEDLDGLEIALDAASTLAGGVFNTEGERLGGAEIREGGSELPPGVMAMRRPLAVTDGEGRYRAENLEPGPMSLKADHAAYQTKLETLELTAGENRLDFTLEGGRAVSGYVVDPARRAVEGARVQLRTSRMDWNLPVVRSAPDGRFEFQGLAPGSYELVAEKAGVGRSPAAVPVRVSDVPVDGIELELAPTAVIRGSIFGLNLDELARVQLQAGGLVGVGSVAHDGSYRIPDLSPGKWSVLAIVPRTGRTAGGEVVVHPGDTEAVLDLDFGAGLALSGRVLMNGEALVGAAIAARRTGGAVVWSETDHGGRFRFESLPAGTYELEVLDLSTGQTDRRAVDLFDEEHVLMNLRRTDSGRP